MTDSLKEMRTVYAETLISLVSKNKDIIVLEADLMKATGTAPFAKAYPERIFNIGVAEANMLGIAAGLSTLGKIPFADTFTCFASRRAFDQFFISCNYAGLNVKLVGADPGICAAFNGGTHMSFEDLVLMRSVPKLTIVEPSDPVSLAAFVTLAAEYQGCVYIRMHRKTTPVLYPSNETFEFGKGKILRDGSDAVIISLGALLTNEALKAAKILESEGINLAIVDILSLKPFDSELVLKYAHKCKRVISLENGQLAGALGSAVSETLAESGVKTKFKRIGIDNEFGEVGTQDWLLKRFKLSAEDIVLGVKGLF